MYIQYTMHLLFLLHLYNEKEDFCDRVVSIVDF
jgi:heme/copper-type cytochrome/quinol oxidase subunit 4